MSLSLLSCSRERGAALCEGLDYRACWPLTMSATAQMSVETSTRSSAYELESCAHRFLSLQALYASHSSMFNVYLGSAACRCTATTGSGSYSSCAPPSWTSSRSWASSRRCSPVISIARLSSAAVHAILRRWQQKWLCHAFSKGAQKWRAWRWG